MGWLRRCGKTFTYPNHFHRMRIHSFMRKGYQLCAVGLIQCWCSLCGVALIINSAMATDSKSGGAADAKSKSGGSAAAAAAGGNSASLYPFGGSLYNLQLEIS